MFVSCCCCCWLFLVPCRRDRFHSTMRRHHATHGLHSDVFLLPAPRGKGKSRNAPNLFYRLFSLVMFTCFFYIFRLMHFLHRIFIIVTAYGQMKASDICAHHLCECDRQFAECIRNYPCPAKKTTCPSNPLRSLGWNNGKSQDNRNIFLTAKIVFYFLFSWMFSLNNPIVFFIFFVSSTFSRPPCSSPHCRVP